MRERWNPPVVRPSSLPKPPSPSMVALIERFDKKAAHDIQTCGRETMDRRCPTFGKVWKMMLSCGSWACPRCSDRRNGSNTDWVAFKVYEVIHAIRRMTGIDYSGAFWQFEGTAPSGEYQYRIARKGMGEWKRLSYDHFRQYLSAQKPQFQGLELACYVYGQNWRTGDPLGVGRHARRFHSAYHYHTHGFCSALGWDKQSGRLKVVENPSSEMWIESRYPGMGDFDFKECRASYDALLREKYGDHSAPDIDFHFEYRRDAKKTEYRNWYSGRSFMWDINKYLENHSLPSGLHTESKSYLHSLFMVRNFQRYSGYGLYSSYYWKRSSPWLKFLGLQLPTRPQFERSVRMMRCPDDSAPLDVDMTTVAPTEAAAEVGAPVLFRMSTRAFKRRLSRKYRR
ncbi:MAG: hypothetical protein ABSB26_06235 [Nitrososphaerales archaeon]